MNSHRTVRQTRPPTPPVRRSSRRRPEPHRGTPFEARVYAVVRRIPRGQTRSYRWVAQCLGNPMLARAVGAALNRNPCLPARRPGRGGADGRRACRCLVRRARLSHSDSLHVPCHRVIHVDGTLGGYALGPACKRRLLAREGRRQSVKTRHT